MIKILRPADTLYAPSVQDCHINESPTENKSYEAEAPYKILNYYHKNEF